MSRLLEDPFVPGQLVNERFRILRVAGRGGMGVVYEAHDEKLDRRIAIKCAQTGHQHRLPPEARSAREVTHSNVCKVHELHTAGEVDFLTMEFVQGETLSQRIRRDGPLKDPEAKQIALQVCAGLTQAHKQGVIHGDLKCGNVILSKAEDGSLRAVLTDFGLAKLAVGEVGSTGGTPDYMAPELFFHEPMSKASDVYALGVLLHVMLTGAAPARERRPRAMEVPAAGGDVPTVTLPEIRDDDWRRTVAALPGSWGRIVERCLRARPVDRYRSAEEVSEAIAPKPRPWRWVAAAMLVVTPVSAYAVWQSQRDTGPPVRLAMLAPLVEGEALSGVGGMIHDIGNRLHGARRNFLVITPGADVKTVEDAKSVSSATHVLRTRLRQGAGRLEASAAVVDTETGRNIAELNGTYSPGDLATLSKALTGTVTGALRLKKGVPGDTVSQAAYPYYSRGLELVKRDQLSADEAIPLLQKAIELDPKSALPYAALAEAQLQKVQLNFGKSFLDAAGENIARAKSLNPDSGWVRIVSGRWNRERGKYEEAVEDFRRAAEVDPGDVRALGRLAAVYGITSRPNEALKAFHRAIDAQPDYAGTYMDLGIYQFRAGQYSEAAEAFRNATRLAPRLADGWSNLGGVLLRLGEYPEAERALVKAVEVKKTAAIYTNLGVVYNFLGRPAEALKAFESAAELAPPSELLYRNMGFTYRRLGKKKEALDVYRLAKDRAEVTLRDNPRRPTERAALAISLAYLGDKKRAESEIAQARSLGAENADVMRLAVLAYEALNERKNALEVVRNAPPSLIAALEREPDLDALRKDPNFLAVRSGKPIP